MCNLAYAWLRADLVASTAMCDGKDRARALEDFDLAINAPAGGWATDEDIQRALRAA